MERASLKCSRSEWMELVEQCEKSQVSIKAWCLERSIPYKQFLYWRTRLKNPSQLTSKPSSTSFIELSDKHSGLSGIEIHCHSINLVLHKDFDASSLFRCLQVLEKL